MKNKLSDLNDHLFAQLERLGEEDLDAEKIEMEANRAKAIIGLSDKIIANANIQLKAVDIIAKHGDRFKNQLPMIGQDKP